MWENDLLHQEPPDKLLFLYECKADQAAREFVVKYDEEYLAGFLERECCSTWTRSSPMYRRRWLQAVRGAVAKSYRMGPESRAAVEAARAQGLNLPEKPSEEMRDAMPKDLTELDDDPHGDVHPRSSGGRTTWLSSSSLASLPRPMNVASNASLSFEAKALIQAKSVASKVTDARLLVKDDPAIQDIHEKAASAGRTGSSSSRFGQQLRTRLGAAIPRTNRRTKQGRSWSKERF